MALLILVAFIGIPLIEIALFIQVGGLIGVWATIAIVILTAMLGTALLRRQGMETLRRAQVEMQANRMPVRELFDGACLLAAGFLLLTPGFLTDTIGFALLIPPLRAVVGLWVWRSLQRHGTVYVHTSGFEAGSAPGQGAPGQGGRGPDGRGPIIEGDYEDLSEPGRRGASDDTNEGGNGGGRRLPGGGPDGGGPSDGDPSSPWRRGG